MPLNIENDALVAAILEKPWNELEVLEHAGYLLFPEELKRKRRDGSWETIPVMLRVPREPDMRKARIQAREWAKEEELDTELDADLFDNLDTMCTLALCIRNATPPHESWEPDPKTLEAKYDRPCLDELWAKLDSYRNVIDPRPSAISDEDALILVATLAESSNIVPLAGFDGAAQSSFILSMASQLQSLRDSKSSSESSGSLTVEGSGSSDSSN